MDRTSISSRLDEDETVAPVVAHPEVSRWILK